MRTGGGYMYLYEYLLHYAKSECLKMGLTMMKKNQDFKTTVINFIKRHPDTQQAQKDFKKRCPAGID